MGEERITILVDSDQRDRWETFIDQNPDANNMSHLLRLAVEDYISDSDDGELESEQLDNVEQQTERLQTELAQIQDTLQVIKANQFTEDELEYIVERAAEGALL